MNIAEFENQRKRLGKVITAIMILALLWCAYGASIDAGAQTLEPTPVCTLTPDGEQCTSSIATTGTPTATPVVPPPFVPTATGTPTVVPTAMPTATATPVTLTPLPACVVEKCVWLPIGVKP